VRRSVRILEEDPLTVGSTWVTWYLSTGRGKVRALSRTSNYPPDVVCTLASRPPKADNDRGTIATDDQLALEMDVWYCP